MGLDQHPADSYVFQAVAYGGGALEGLCDITLTKEGDKRYEYVTVGKLREVLLELGMVPDRVTVNGAPYFVMGVYGTAKDLDDVHAKHGGETEIGLGGGVERWRRILRRITVCGITLSVLDEWRDGEPPEED